ncbi:MAG: ABC transporter ATP-binding protein [Peptococcaceae bacterium]|nr:ABC transporter ATP-binding protein [Peptococcaceae bacterium]
MDHQPVLCVENLQVRLAAPRGTVRAVNGVTFRLEAGRVLGLVGESGCGKSVTCLSLLGLLGGAGRVEGRVLLRGRNILDLPPGEVRRIRGKEIALVLQNPMSAFNPVVTLGTHFVETIRSHLKVTAKEAREMAVVYLRRVGLPRPAELMNTYPFQLSGGMLQRAMIAIALALNPAVLIADEPTTALDATVRLQVLGCLARLQEQCGAAILLVSHDLEVIAHLADEIAVMYCGYIVEQAPAAELLARPLHPYTRALVASRPGLQKKRLQPVGGQPPSLLDLPEGCPFRERCREADRRCPAYGMELLQPAGGRMVRCVKYRSGGEAAFGEPA